MEFVIITLLAMGIIGYLVYILKKTQQKVGSLENQIDELNQINVLLEQKNDDLEYELSKVKSELNRLKSAIVEKASAKNPPNWDTEAKATIKPTKTDVKKVSKSSYYEPVVPVAPTVVEETVWVPSVWSIPDTTEETPVFTGNGGQFDGGGASDSYDAPSSSSSSSSYDSGSSYSSSSYDSGSSSSSSSSSYDSGSSSSSSCDSGSSSCGCD